MSGPEDDTVPGEVADAEEKEDASETENADKITGDANETGDAEKETSDDITTSIADRRAADVFPWVHTCEQDKLSMEVATSFIERVRSEHHDRIRIHMDKQFHLYRQDGPLQEAKNGKQQHADWARGNYYPILQQYIEVLEKPTSSLTL